MKQWIEDLIIFGLCLVVFVSGFMAGLAAADPPPLPPCATEDSVNCYWDAQQRGNGEGRSFVNYNGQTYYLGK